MTGFTSRYHRAADASRARARTVLGVPLQQVSDGEYQADRPGGLVTFTFIEDSPPYWQVTARMARHTFRTLTKAVRWCIDAGLLEPSRPTKP